MPTILALLGATVILWWWLGSGKALRERVPGADLVNAIHSVGVSADRFEGQLVKSNGLPANLPGAWPRFRGTNLDNISREETPLARSWGPAGPEILWSLDVGEGYAGAAVWQGRVFVLDYDRAAQKDALRCLSLADGQEIWRYAYPMKLKRWHGFTRTVPAITDKYLVSIGPKCQVLCLDPASGELRWAMNLVREFSAEVPQWYTGQCPLIDGDRAILAPGGDALLVAVDCQSGQVIWKTPNPHNWQMTHSSVVPTEFKGRRQYVYCASGGVVGVSASDGTLLWETPDWTISMATVPSPVPIGDGRIFLCGGYEAGSLMLQLEETGSGYTVRPLFRLKHDFFGAVQHSPIFYQDHLFGVRLDGQMVCLDLQGKLTWKSAGEHRFGSGPFLLAQGLIFALDERGTLVLVEASTQGYKELAKAKVLPGEEAWGPLALAGGRLIARDYYKMVCLNVSRR